MKININEFQNVLKKGTLNYSIESIGLKFFPDKIKCNMISQERNALLFLNIPNTVIEGINDEIEMNWNEPSVKVKPYISILDENVVDLKVKDEFIKIDKKIRINFDHEDTINNYGKDNPVNEIKFFKETQITDDFIESFNKIKKVGNRFGKIYFVVKDNKIYIESTDKLNRFSNSVKFKICDCEHKDIDMCFSYKNLVSLMDLINLDFTLKFCYIEENGLGCIAMFNEDESERYYLMSMMEN